MQVEAIGRYQVRKVIGSGGMATVYQAFDPRFKRDVAIKMMHQHSLNDVNAVQKFEQEAQIIAALEHRAIVPVYDYGDSDGRPYIVMRLMNGGSLKEVMHIRSLTLRETSGILNRICSALDKAHTNHIVHRDIKPGNILFDEDGVAYLADFGIARLTDVTQTLSVIGSPRYMAPEQAQGLPLDGRTDVYQMGAVLFELLTGQVPYDGDTSETILFKHVYDPIPIPSEANPFLPPFCDGVISRALAKQPAERFATAGELARAFREGLQQSATAAPPPPPPVTPSPPQPEPRAAALPADNQPTIPPPQPQQKSSPNWMLYIGLTALIFALCACGAVIFGVGELGLLASGNEEPAIVVPTRLAEEETAGEDEPPVVDLAPTVTLAGEATPTLPSQISTATASELAAIGGGTGRVAYAAKRGDSFDIYILNEDGTETQLTFHDDDAFSPEFSPDGQQIAYHTLQDTWEIYVMDVDGSNAFNLTSHPADDSFPQWSPEGNQIAFHSNRNGNFDIFVIDRDGDNLRQLTADERHEFGPSWSPDGGRIAYQTRLDDGRRQLYVMDADGANAQQITAHESGESLFPVWSPDGSRLAFHSNQDGTWRIYTIRPDGSDVQQMSGGEGLDFYPGWTSNGEWIVYHKVTGDENREVWMTRADGSGESVQVTAVGLEERMPSWQP